MKAPGPAGKNRVSRPDLNRVKDKHLCFIYKTIGDIG